MQRLLKILAVMAVLMGLSASPAMAQATRTWVSGVGDDVNPCSRTAPCKTFAGAISKTAAAGEINCIDSGGFGAVTITKSITISCSEVEAGVLVSGTSGIIINAAASDRVVLRGLDIEGLSNGTSLYGVNILSAFDVLIEDTVIHGFNSATSAGVRVNTATTSRVTVRDSTIQSNTLAATVTSTGGTGHLKVVDSLILDNTSGGLSVDGAGNDIEIINNRIFGPVGLIQTNSGVVRSYGGNVIPSAVTPAATAATK